MGKLEGSPGNDHKGLSSLVEELKGTSDPTIRRTDQFITK